LIETIAAEIKPANHKMTIKMLQEENLEAAREVLLDAVNDVMKEMIATDQAGAGIVILFLFPRYRCIFLAVM
jgi:hypothetical protein